MKILGIIGSVFGSKTRIAMQNLHFSEDVVFETVDLSETTLAFSDGRDFRDYDEVTKNVVQKILDADALVLATPIYNASIPGALKNVLDLLPIDSIKDKVVGIIVTAGSDKHYLVTQYHLMPVLDYMKASVLTKYVFIEENSFINGQLEDDDVYFRLKALPRNIEEEVVQVKAALEARYDF